MVAICLKVIVLRFLKLDSTAKDLEMSFQILALKYETIIYLQISFIYYNYR